MNVGLASVVTLEISRSFLVPRITKASTRRESLHFARYRNLETTLMQVHASYALSYQFSENGTAICFQEVGYCFVNAGHERSARGKKT